LRQDRNAKLRQRDMIAPGRAGVERLNRRRQRARADGVPRFRSSGGMVSSGPESQKAKIRSRSRASARNVGPPNCSKLHSRAKAANMGQAGALLIIWHQAVAARGTDRKRPQRPQANNRLQPAQLAYRSRSAGKSFSIAYQSPLRAVRTVGAPITVRARSCPPFSQRAAGLQPEHSHRIPIAWVLAILLVLSNSLLSARTSCPSERGFPRTIPCRISRVAYCDGCAGAADAVIACRKVALASGQISPPVQ